MGNKSAILVIRNIGQISRDIVDISEGKITLPYQKDFVIDENEPAESNNFIDYAQTAVEMGLGEEYICTIETDKANESVLRVTIDLDNNLSVN